MILVTHILIGVISIFYSIFTIFFPSEAKVKNIYFLTFGTIIYGIALIATTPATFGRFCISGLLYLVFIATTLKICKLALKS